MAQTDSRLGWSCNEDYYVYNAETVIITHPTDGPCKKKNDGAAIAIGFQWTDANMYNSICISTNSDFSELYGTDSANGYALSSFEYLDLVWYAWSMENSSQSQPTSFPMYSEPLGHSYPLLEEDLINFLQEANVQITSSATKVPSTTYVKTFVKEIETETATRVNKIRNSIATSFNSTENYSIGNLVFYDNQLYSCTTAHTGVWDNTHFSQRTLVDFLNSSDTSINGRTNVNTTTLFETSYATGTTSNITLSDSFENYDFLYFVTAYNTNSDHCINCIHIIDKNSLIEALNQGYFLTMYGYDNNYIDYTITSSTSMNFDDNNSLSLIKVIGIKLKQQFNTNVTALAEDWVGNNAPYSQTIIVNNITANDSPILDVILSNTVETALNEEKQWGYITKAETGTNIITLYCYKTKPTIDLNFIVKVI